MLGFPYLLAPQPLPPIQPGALPRLKQFNLRLDWQERPLSLPPSWGTPEAWPLLQELVLVMPVQLPLPAGWGRGFARLRELYVTRVSWSAEQTTQPVITAAQQAAYALPAEWAGGFPRLEKLTLAGLGLGGTLPAAWLAAGSFPRVRVL